MLHYESKALNTPCDGWSASENWTGALWDVLMLFISQPVSLLGCCAPFRSNIRCESVFLAAQSPGSSLFFLTAVCAKYGGVRREHRVTLQHVVRWHKLLWSFTGLLSVSETYSSNNGTFHMLTENGAEFSFITCCYWCQTTTTWITFDPNQNWWLWEKIFGFSLSSMDLFSAEVWEICFLVSTEQTVFTWKNWAYWSQQYGPDICVCAPYYLFHLMNNPSFHPLHLPQGQGGRWILSSCHWCFIEWTDLNHQCFETNMENKKSGKQNLFEAKVNKTTSSSQLIS